MRTALQSSLHWGFAAFLCRHFPETGGHYFDIIAFMIFDTHCHGYWHGLADRQEEVRRNMNAAGVVRSMHVGSSLETSLKALKLARDWGEDTWCSIGFHPSACQDLPRNSATNYAEQLESIILANRDKVVAVGESGLDYYHVIAGRKDEQKRTQQEFFRAQAELSRLLHLPLIIHTRDAAEDTIALLKESGARQAVIHCFSENAEFARRLMTWSDGIYFSFSGILTYKRSLAVQEAARAIPLEQILVETDAPFLVPQDMRDAFPINEPALTRSVMEYLKTLRTEPGETLEQAVWQNSNRFFGITEFPARNKA